MTRGPLRGESELDKSDDGYAGEVVYFAIPLHAEVTRCFGPSGEPRVRLRLYDAPLPPAGEPMPEYLRCAVLDDPEPAREKPVQSAPVRIRDHGDDAIPDLCGPAVQDALL